MICALKYKEAAAAASRSTRSKPDSTGLTFRAHESRLPWHGPRCQWEEIDDDPR